MAPATKTQDPAAEKVFTEKQLADQEAALTKLREEMIPGLEEEREELRERVASAVESGEEPEEAWERLSEVEGRLEEFRGVAPVLERRIRDRRRKRIRHKAEQRLRLIQKRIGGLAGEAPRRAAKARELAEKLALQVEWLSHAPLRRQLLKREARALAGRLRLGGPRPPTL